MADRGERPLNEYLDICDEAGVKCTFFFIGWYAQSFPHRIHEVVRRGHEIGCHSLMHEDVASQSQTAFTAATRQAKEAIEDAGGAAVHAYRAPSFSFPPERCKELLGILHSLGFTIDSSITTAERIYGGGYSKSVFSRPSNLLSTIGVDIFEIPVPGVSFLGKDVQVFGGGYLRLSPPSLLKHIMKRQDYQVLYLHPHDFDRDLPPLPNAGKVTNLRRKIQVGDLRHKVLDLFARARVKSCGELLVEAGAQHV
jgi:peptidoglycan/xylan/chitin deacetylase (PgdA/CDA1 family)